jgi:hypothetical protein
VIIKNDSGYTQASVRKFAMRSWLIVKAELTAKQIAKANYKGARFRVTDRLGFVSMICYWFARAGVRVPKSLVIPGPPPLVIKPAKVKAKKHVPTVFDAAARWDQKLAKAEARLRDAQRRLWRCETAFNKVAAQRARAKTRATKVLATTTDTTTMPVRDFAARMRARRAS